MNQVMDVICAVGNIHRERDTVMHTSLMDGKKKEQVMSNIKEEWK